jgi:hypothetical protein
MADDVPVVVMRIQVTAGRCTQAAAAVAAGSVAVAWAVAVSTSAGRSTAGVRASARDFPGRRLAGRSSQHQKRSAQKDSSRAESLHRLPLSGVDRTGFDSQHVANAQCKRSTVARAALRRCRQGLCGASSFFSFVRIRRQTRMKVALTNSRFPIFDVANATARKTGTHVTSGRLEGSGGALPVTRGSG